MQGARFDPKPSQVGEKDKTNVKKKKLWSERGCGVGCVGSDQGLGVGRGW